MTVDEFADLIGTILGLLVLALLVVWFALMI